MQATAPTTLHLTDRKWETASELGLNNEDISEVLAKAGKFIECSTAQDKGMSWKITPRGYIGHLPVSERIRFLIEPKVPIGNLFRMIEVATGFEAKVFDSSFFVGDLSEVFERLARHLSKMVMQICRSGLYRTYAARQEELKYIRGSINPISMVMRPHKLQFDCRFEEHTPDIAENRILAWALRQISSMPFRSETTSLALRALGMLRSEVALVRMPLECCLDRDYNRLNLKYEPLHHLCWFFLANCGPVFDTGDHMIRSFLLNIDKLFETFVARWLQNRLPREGMRVDPQYSFNVQHLEFKVDILIKDSEGATLAVLDTKYKDADKPRQDDVSQVVTYALANKCRDAILVYPSPLSMPLDSLVGDIRVRSLWFDLEKDLEEAGEQLASAIMPVRRLPLSSDTG